MIYSRFNALTAQKATHLQTLDCKEVYEPASLGDWVHRMTPNYASSGVAIAGHAIWSRGLVNIVTQCPVLTVTCANRSGYQATIEA